MEGADWLRGRWAEPKILGGSDVQQLRENKTHQKEKERNIQTERFPTPQQSAEHGWLLLRCRRHGEADRCFWKRIKALMLASDPYLKTTKNTKKSERAGNRQSRKYGFQPQTTSEEPPPPPPPPNPTPHIYPASITSWQFGIPPVPQTTDNGGGGGGDAAKQRREPPMNNRQVGVGGWGGRDCRRR